MSHTALTKVWVFAALAWGALGIHSAFAAEEVSVTDEPLHLNSYQINFSNSLRAQQGGFDQFGAYHSYPAGSDAWSYTSNIGGSYRLSQKWEVDASASFRKSESTFPTGDKNSFSYGSPTFDVKYHLGLWPHLVIYAGASPGWVYGKNHTDGNPTASLYDDFGDGNFMGAAANAGIGASRSIHRFRIAFNAGTIVPFTTRMYPTDPPNAPSYVMRAGNRYQLSEGLGYTLSDQWGLNGGFKQMWGMDSSVEGTSTANTAGRLFTTNFGATYNSSPQWRWMASFETSYPFYSYIVNQSYAPAVSLGVTYAGI
jgi:hypothetical protein